MDALQLFVEQKEDFIVNENNKDSKSNTPSNKTNIMDVDGILRKNIDQANSMITKLKKMQQRLENAEAISQHQGQPMQINKEEVKEVYNEAQSNDLIAKFLDELESSQQNQSSAAVQNQSTVVSGSVVGNINEKKIELQNPIQNRIKNFCKFPVTSSAKNNALEDILEEVEEEFEISESEYENGLKLDENEVINKQEFHSSIQRSNNEFYQEQAKSLLKSRTMSNESTDSSNAQSLPAQSAQQAQQPDGESKEEIESKIFVKKAELIDINIAIEKILNNDPKEEAQVQSHIEALFAKADLINKDITTLAVQLENLQPSNNNNQSLQPAGQEGKIDISKFANSDQSLQGIQDLCKLLNEDSQSRLDVVRKHDEDRQQSRNQDRLPKKQSGQSVKDQCL
jgi:hypothetical protein